MTVDQSLTSLYTTFDITDKCVEQVYFKQALPADRPAFTGVMYINNWQQFFNRLASLDSNEFIGCIQPGAQTRQLASWLDFGNPEIYTTEVSKTQLFDFTKRDEVTYICNNRVVKWWADPAVAEKKYTKALTNPDAYPNNCAYQNNHLVYDYFPGLTMYQHNHHVMFDRMLFWLHNEVWQLSSQPIELAARDFYMNKTLKRIDLFKQRYPELPQVCYVDGVAVKSYDHYLERIDWNYLAQTARAGYTHGDLQFDNVILSPQGRFKCIDWRQDFGGIVEYGDIYYDLAKLMGGLIINYSKIKQHMFGFEQDGDRVTLSVPHIDNWAIYQAKLKKYVVNNDLDYDKIRLLVPIIFWNMAPLHTQPFDLFLWYLGIKLFEELDSETTISS
jgi:thiamine kinase-like enzyme